MLLCGPFHVTSVGPLTAAPGHKQPRGDAVKGQDPHFTAFDVSVSTSKSELLQERADEPNTEWYSVHASGVRGTSGVTSSRQTLQQAGSGLRPQARHSHLRAWWR